jgi:hypothetical protein
MVIKLDSIEDRDGRAAQSNIESYQLRMDKAFALITEFLSSEDGLITSVIPGTLAPALLAYIGRGGAENIIQINQEYTRDKVEQIEQTMVLLDEAGRGIVLENMYTQLFALFRNEDSFKLNYARFIDLIKKLDPKLSFFTQSVTNIVQSRNQKLLGGLANSMAGLISHMSAGVRAEEYTMSAPDDKMPKERPSFGSVFDPQFSTAILNALLNIWQNAPTLISVLEKVMSTAKSHAKYRDGGSEDHAIPIDHLPLTITIKAPYQNRGVVQELGPDFLEYLNRSLYEITDVQTATQVLQVIYDLLSSPLFTDWQGDSQLDHLLSHLRSRCYLELVDQPGAGEIIKLIFMIVIKIETVLATSHDKSDYKSSSSSRVWFQSTIGILYSLIDECMTKYQAAVVDSSGQMNHEHKSLFESLITFLESDPTFMLTAFCTRFLSGYEGILKNGLITGIFTKNVERSTNILIDRLPINLRKLLFPKVKYEFFQLLNIISVLREVFAIYQRLIGVEEVLTKNASTNSSMNYLIITQLEPSDIQLVSNPISPEDSTFIIKDIFPNFPQLEHPFFENQTHMSSLPDELLVLLRQNDHLSQVAVYKILSFFSRLPGGLSKYIDNQEFSEILIKFDKRDHLHRHSELLVIAELHQDLLSVEATFILIKFGKIHISNLSPAFLDQLAFEISARGKFTDSTVSVKNHPQLSRYGFSKIREIIDQSINEWEPIFKQRRVFAAYMRICEYLDKQ